MLKKLTKKEQFLQDLKFLKELESDKIEYFSVGIETQGMEGVELIINPIVNIDQKINYYDKSYNDDLVLNSCDEIRIVSVDVGRHNTKLSFLNTIEDFR